jgi:predicted transcriptional regulator/8-oxo-dGTP pyrophosphatase MutT (NUDIX family)
MRVDELHKAQVSILWSLRHTTSARYSSLMRPTGLESDVFKFHLRKLLNQKIIEKNLSGEYFLTKHGKEFANNLSKAKPAIQKQPKLSVAIIASRDTSSGKLYLFQKRRRNPFYGFWGCITGPVQWGEDIEETAKREFKKQTGLSASYKVHSFYRKSDYDQEAGELLEDKLFAVIKATDVQGGIDNSWHGGFNTWMSLDELEEQEKYFKSSRDLINMLDSDRKYSAEKALYFKTDY